MKEQVHLQIDMDLDVKKPSRSRNVWLIRTTAGGFRITWKDPTHSGICGYRTGKFARRGELNKITCRLCRKYYLQYVGRK